MRVARAYSTEGPGRTVRVSLGGDHVPVLDQLLTDGVAGPVIRYDVGRYHHGGRCAALRVVVVHVRFEPRRQTWLLLFQSLGRKAAQGWPSCRGCVALHAWDPITTPALGFVTTGCSRSLAG